jgi:hypothetical protein
MRFVLRIRLLARGFAAGERERWLASPVQTLVTREHLHRNLIWLTNHPTAIRMMNPITDTPNSEMPSFPSGIFENGLNPGPSRSSHVIWPSESAVKTVRPM